MDKQVLPSSDSYKERIRATLAKSVHRDLGNTGLLPAGVLALLGEGPDGLYVILTRRTDQVELHKRLISFPGGAKDEGDEGLAATALRETEEEVGVRPEDVDILGELAGTVTHPFIVAAFVATIPYPYPFNPSTIEVAEIIAIPLRELRGLGRFGAHPQLYSGHRPTDYYDHPRGLVWGATARLLNQLLAALDEAGVE